MPALISRVRLFFRELSRRHVYRVAGVYAAVCFVVFQVAELIFEALRIPEWAFTLTVVLGLLGAPIALVLAWAFDLTPEGVQRTPPAGTATGSGSAPDPTPAPHASLRTGEAPRNSVAVLPFANLSDSRENEYFSDGITDDVIASLCRARSLKVISRTSVMQYRDRRRSLREIGAELGVAAVLEGSVRRDGARVRIVAQLVDVASDQHLWAEVYDRRLEDIFAIQAEVAREIARALEVELSPRAERETGPSPTVSIEAYDLYLKGRYLWNRRTPDDIRRAREELERALALDPRFTLAYAALADVDLTLGIYGAAPPTEVMPRALRAAEHALALDPGLAEALTARACVRAIYEWDWDGAERDFQLALRSGPQYATAHHWYALHCLGPRGRFEEAWAALEGARELDPVSPALGASLAVVHHFQRRPEAAAGVCRGVLAANPDFSLAHFFLGQALEALGRRDEAVRALEEAVRLSRRSAEAVAALAHALAGRGDEARARELLNELEARAAHAYTSPVLLAQVHTALGEREAALSRLEEAVEQRSADLIWLGVRPVFDPLRGEARFEALLDSVGLPAGLARIP
jgi:serine/threonine-protein kinase